MHIASRSHRSEHDRPEQRRSGGRRNGLATLVFEDNVATRGLARSAFVEGQNGKGIATGANHVHSVDNTGNPTQDGQTDVDQEVSTASVLQEDTQRRQDDGEDDLADIAVKSIPSVLLNGARIKGLVVRPADCAALGSSG